MTGNDSRGRWLAAIVTTVLVASAGVAVFAGPAAAQDSGGAVQVTETYHWSPDYPDGHLTVELAVENPEAADQIYVEDDEDVVSVETDGFTYDGSADEWVAEDGVDRPTINVTFDSDVQAYDEYAVYYPRYDRPQVSARDAQGDWVSTEATHHVENGLDTVSEALYFGEYDRTTTEAGDAVIEVVAVDEQRVGPDLDAIASALASVDEAASGGETDENVTMFALRGPVDDHGATGRGYALEDRAYTRPDLELYGAGSTWIHEHVHLTEGVYTDTSMDWFSEGYAEYGSYYFTLEAGYAGFDDFRQELGSGVSEPSDLSDPSTWDGDEYDVPSGQTQNDYYQGAMVLGAIDRDVRQATGGEETLQDVVRKMHAHDRGVNRSDFLGMINETVTGSTDHSAVGAKAATWTVSDDPSDLPETWDYATHNATFGPAPRLTVENETMYSASPTGNYSVRNDTAIRNGTRIVVEQRIENAGDTPVRAGTVLEASSWETFELSEIDWGAATIAPGETGVVRTSVSPNGVDETFEVDSEVDRSDVTVVASDAEIVRATGPNDAPDDGVTVVPSTSDVVFDAAAHDATVTVRDQSGSTVGSDTAGVFQIAEPVSVDDLSPGTRYNVTFENASTTQHLTMLEPVDGTYPRDLNGDGLHRDMDADGDVDDTDVDVFFEHQHRSSVDDYPEAYDYSGNGEVSHGDVQALYNYVNS